MIQKSWLYYQNDNDKPRPQTTGASTTCTQERNLATHLWQDQQRLVGNAASLWSSFLGWQKSSLIPEGVHLKVSKWNTKYTTCIIRFLEAIRLSINSRFSIHTQNASLLVQAYESYSIIQIQNYLKTLRFFVFFWHKHWILWFQTYTGNDPDECRVTTSCLQSLPLPYKYIRISYSS